MNLCAKVETYCIDFFRKCFSQLTVQILLFFLQKWNIIEIDIAYQQRIILSEREVGKEIPRSILPIFAQEQNFQTVTGWQKPFFVFPNRKNKYLCIPPLWKCEEPRIPGLTHDFMINLSCHIC
jgi:hypothetical protein